MKSRKFVVAMVGVFLMATMLVSCHHNTCPTFGKAETVQFEECV